MNEELKTIFDKLPEGIILFDSDTKKVTLTNLEFKRLFNCHGHPNINEIIESKVHDVKLKKYTPTINDNDMNNTFEWNQHNMLDIFEAS